MRLWTGVVVLEIDNPGVRPPTRESLLVADALRYWEPRRILFNVVLGAVVIANLWHWWPSILAGPPGSPEYLRKDLLSHLARLALGANLFYCAAYPIDLYFMEPERGGVWPRRRWLLLAAGTSLAVLIAQFLMMALIGQIMYWR